MFQDLYGDLKWLINLRKGGTTSVNFEYERVQKRCYECQRLTHERDFCPILINKRLEIADARRLGLQVEKPRKEPVLKVSDPLFGVLSEDQVGIDPMTGRPRIAPVVLEGMRQYLRVSGEEEMKIRVDKVKSSVKEVEKDPIAKKSVLQLEPPPIIHSDVNKGKGLVFSFDRSNPLRYQSDFVSKESKYSDVAMRYVGDSSGLMSAEVPGSLVVPSNFLALSQPFQNTPTVFCSGSFVAGSSGTISKKVKARKRPSKSTRVLKPKEAFIINESQKEKLGLKVGEKDKRKAVDLGTSTAKASKLNPKQVVPNEGLPNV